MNIQDPKEGELQESPAEETVPETETPLEEVSAEEPVEEDATAPAEA